MEKISTTRTWKWRWLWLVCVLLAALGIYSWCSKYRRWKDGSTSAEEHAKMCARRHEPFPPRSAKPPPPPRPRGKLVAAAALDPDPYLTGDCPYNGCGLNGTWLGNGVPFRTLHLSKYRHNELNLSVIGFQDPNGNPLTLEVTGDVLHGTGSTMVQSGSILYLGPPETPAGPPSTPTYALKITNVDTTTPFWQDCPDCTNQHVPVYEFTATDLADECDVEVCDPALDPSHPAGISGNAVIFRGDFYDDSYTVRTTPASDYDDDVFNIACMGSAISKLHRLRHTSASRINSHDPVAPHEAERQALLRLLTADYCGVGHPFTHDGVGIRLGFDGALNPAPAMTLTTASGFGLDPAGPLDRIDALWTGAGATCIHTPRLLAEEPGILATIQARCAAAGHALPDCATTSLAAPWAPSFPLTSYAISQLPAP